MVEESRGLAVCAECGRKYAARELADGTMSPIGCPDSCKSCGCTEFEAFSLSGDDSDSDGTDLRS